MAAIPNNVFDVHTPIVLGLLRNGNAANVARTARESSIAAKYYYSTVRYNAALDGDAAAFRPACPAVVIFEANFRTTFSTMVEAAVAEAQVAHAAGGAGGAFNAGQARTDARADASLRLEAIAIGATRTALVKSYQILEADLRATEAIPSILALNAPAAAANAAALVALERTVTAGWTIVVTSGHVANALNAAETTAFQVAPLTNDEIELGFALMVMGQASPVRGGAQLFMDGHHYHSDVESSARHRAIEKEVLARVSESVKNTWRANTKMLQNAVWHASIHPVLEDVLQQFAEDDDMPERLDATGYGSLSVGLPAQEDLFSRAGSYIAVYNQIIQTARAHNHVITIDNMTAAVTAMSGLPRRGALPANRPDLPGLPAAPWPAGCDTRAKALKQFLEPYLDAAEPVAAWMFGFYKDICSRASVRASSQEGSLLRSYSLKRAVANYVSEANTAQEMYAARARWVRTQAEAGNIEVYRGTA